jgi:hypothetical protein
VGLLVTVVMPYRSGLPKDIAVNNWTVGGIGGSLTGAQATLIRDVIMGFYNTVPTAGGPAFSAAMHPCLSRATDAVKVKFYDISAHLDGSPHGSPIFERTSTLVADTSNNVGLPEECSLVLTLEAAGRALQLVETADGVDVDLAPDRPRQRFTGRFHLGPWGSYATVNEKDAVGASRPTAALRNAIRSHYSDVADNLPAAVAGTWFGVWSRKDEAIRSIDNVKTDDSWDTMRSRGATPTARASTAVAVTPAVELAA